MAGLHVPRPLGIVRTAPAVLVVLPVPQCVKRLLPSRSRDIQALAGLKIAARRQDMHVDPPARFAVLDRCPGVAVRFEARPGGFLELVHHSADLRIARFVLRCPGDDARRVLVLELKRVGHVGHLVRIAPQHFDFFRVLLRVPVLILVLILFGGEVSLAGEVVRRRRCRPGSASEKLDHHRGSPSTVKVSRTLEKPVRGVGPLARSAAVWRKVFVFSSLPIREVLVCLFGRGVSPSLGCFLFCFQRVYPQDRRSYYLFFTTCSLTTCFRSSRIGEESSGESSRIGEESSGESSRIGVENFSESPKPVDKPRGGGRPGHRKKPQE